MSRRRSQNQAAARRARQRRRQTRRLERKRGPATFLHAITSGALALPGFADRASAESAPLEVRTDYKFSRYAEDSLDAGQVAPGGERDRYEIDIHQFRFEAPIGDRWGVGLELAHETMTGATPWYVTPGLTPEDPIQVMTGATIEEARTDAMLTGTRYLDRGTLSGSAGVSVENDYLAINAGINGERQFNEKNTTVTAGIGGSFDQIEPVDTDLFPQRPTKENKQTYNLSVGASQVLGRATTIQSSLKYQLSDGFLSDPYKLAFVANIPETDERPDQRHQFSWLTRFRHHFARMDGTLHLDYKLGLDDWGINAHELELAWYQTLFERIRLIPSLRYYTQSQADFYAPFYIGPRSDGFRSSDYRLSPYGAFAYRLKAAARFQTWQLLWDANVSWERYESAGDLAIQGVDVENPGLVSYNLFSVGLTARF